MQAKTSQLQIRVSPAEKATLKRLATAAGESVSTYVLSRVLPSAELKVAGLLRALTEPGGDHRATMSELVDSLERLSDSELVRVPGPEPGTLTPTQENSVAALVESAAHGKGVAPPAWVHSVVPLARPHFGWTLRALRPHQIRVTPVPFKRRNVFFDPATGVSP